MTTVVPSLCRACLRLRDGVSCDAFPGGIPDEIIRYGGDHRDPTRGDHGLQFSLDPGKRQEFEDWDQTFGENK